MMIRVCFLLLEFYKYDPEFHLKNAASFFSVPGSRYVASHLGEKETFGRQRVVFNP